MKKLIYSTYFDRETENGEIETVTVEGSTIIPDGDLETFLPIAKAEAYKGEVTVKDVPDPEPVPGSNEDVWAELDAAYQEGVNAAYDQ